jgi:hypothetical protein
MSSQSGGLVEIAHLINPLIVNSQIKSTAVYNVKVFCCQPALYIYIFHPSPIFAHIIVPAAGFIQV